MALENTGYIHADISEHEGDVKDVVAAFVDSLAGGTDDEKRVNLPKIKILLQDAVDYVMNNLPDGVGRVDGYCIEPLLNEVCNEKIAELPEPEQPEI